MKNVANATVVAVTLLGLGLSQSTDAGYPDAPDVHPELSRMLQMAGETRETEPMAGLPKRLELVGFLNLGITSDVWAHDDVAFVPPPETGPGVFWGVFEDHDLIFGSDIFSGLFILELTDNDEPDDDSDSD